MFPAYAPSFTLDVPAGNMRDLNSDEYLTHVSAVFGAVSQELLERRLEEDREDMR
jgi:histone deacetylase 8